MAEEEAEELGCDCEEWGVAGGGGGHSSTRDLGRRREAKLKAVGAELCSAVPPNPIGTCFDVATGASGHHYVCSC